MTDDIMDEVRVCTKCGTKTFCDYCPKCGSKMPPGNETKGLKFWERTDFDVFRKNQSDTHQRVAIKSAARPAQNDKKVTHVYTAQGNMSQKATGNQGNNGALQFIAYLIIAIVVLFIFLGI